MAEDNTIMLSKGGQSTIFNTSIRGWIALILAIGLTFCVFLVVIAPYFKIEMPKEVSQTVLTLFTTGMTAAWTHYFHQQSKEGQKPTIPG